MEHREPDRVIPLRIDLSELIRSVATLYSHLVTRPTGQALRMGIESQIGELRSSCLSVLDFTEVVVLDYSCADEIIAKLLTRHQRDGQPVEAYFIARGVDETHRQTIEAVLARHELTLVVELDDGRAALLGETDEAERVTWAALERLARGDIAAVAAAVGRPEAEVGRVLDRLARRGVVAPLDGGGGYVALTSLAEGG